MNYFISEEFRLEIHWQEAIYNKDGVCELVGAYFTGPALNIAQKINDKDHLMLDLFSQYICLVKGVYVVKFSWSGVTYKLDENKVFLDNCFITHNDDLNKVPKLKSKDYFVVDTSDHSFENHMYSMVYKTITIKEDHSKYRFDDE